MKRIFTPTLWVALALIFTGCQNGSTSAVAEKVYPLKGTVVSFNAIEKEVTIDHEDIPGLMKAMKMTFTVEEAKLLDGIKAGSRVEGKVKSASGKYIITELKSVGEVSSEEGKTRAALAKLSPADRTLAEAQALCPVADEPLGSMGVPIKLSVKGQPVFICCKGCKKDAEKDADETLKKVAELKAKKAE